MALELAGFRLIDIIHHCQGSGFPKGQDIGKMLDKLAGEEREIVRVDRGAGTPGGGRMRKCNLKDVGNGKTADGRSLSKVKEYIEKTRQGIIVTAPTTSEAKQWDGWKTPALKPAVEGWWLVQKPISESSIARNILKHGVGGLNIEACRIGTSKRVPGGISKNSRTVYNGGYTGESGDEDGHNPDIGRYPANLILSCGADCKGDNHSLDCPVSVIGEQSGICNSGGSAGNRQFETTMFQGLGKKTFGDDIPKSTGTAARYFKQLPFDPETVSSVYYSAKASTNDRSCGGTVENVHPTVKSRHLMKYLIQLITPEDGTVLDPFAGSGTTALACKELGRNYVCIEKEREYIDIIYKRLNTPITERGLTVEEQVEIEEKIKPPYQQLSLF
jgi:site-specific DNA-methyltransferase (adenine-specific)